MRWRHIGTTLPVLVLIGSLVGCASQGPVPVQNPQLSAQPDTGQTIDYLHFAGISYGDTFDKVIALFGEPTSVDLDDEEYTFATAYYEIQGERCLEVSYDKDTRQVESVDVQCERIRDLLLAKQLDDPKLALFAQPHASVLAKYGSPLRTNSGNYEYEYESEDGPEGLVNFTCYEFWGNACKKIGVQWFYPMSEEELAQTLESIRDDLKEISESKRKKIRQLFELMKIADQSKQIFNAMLSTLKPGIPEDVWEDFLGEVNFEELMEMTVPIYGKHLNEQEIDDLIAFYSSPTGRSFIEKQPLILRDSLTAGREWGRELARKMREKLEARKKRAIGP